MRRRWWIAGAALLLATTGTVSALMSASLPVATVAEVAPKSSIAFVRVKDLTQSYERMQGTEAWKDLVRSRILNTLWESRDAQGMRREFSSRAKRLGLPDTAETYLRFIGKEVAFGVAAHPEMGPVPYMMYRIDSAALMKALAVDSPRGLIQLLTERYFGQNQPSASTYGGYDIYAMPGEGQGFYALLRDVVVASPAEALVKEMIDLANAGGAGSLGKSPAFADEMGRLSGEGNLVEAWIDTQTLRDPAKLKAIAGPAPKGFLETLDRGLKQTPALAVALRASAGDLYAVDVVVSRSEAELFVDTARPDAMAVVPSDAAVRFEVRDLRGMMKAAREAEFVRRLTNQALGVDLGELLEDETVQEAMREVLGDAIQLPPVPEGKDWNTRFETTFIVKLLERIASHALPGDMAIAVGPAGPGSQIPVTIGGAVKLPPVLRFAGVVAMAAAAGENSEDFRVSAAGNSLVGIGSDYDWQTETYKPVVSLGLIGDTFVISSDIGHAKNVAERASTAPATLARTEAGGLKISPDYCARMVLDYPRLFGLMKDAMGPDAGQFEYMFNQIGTIDMGFYIRDGFTTYASEMYVALPANLDETAKRLYDQPGGPFKAWGLLPAETILQYHGRLDAEALLAYYLKAMPQLQADIEAGMQEASQVLGVDVRTELLPALGSEIGLALVRQRSQGGPQAAPAVVLTWTVKDKAVVDRALQSFIGNVLVPQDLPPDLPEEEKAGMPQMKSIPGPAGSTVTCVVPPRDAGVADQFGETVLPGYAIVGDVLMISSGAHVIASAKGGLVSSPRWGRIAEATNTAAASAHVSLDFEGLGAVISEHAESLARAFAPSTPYMPPPFPETPDEQAMEEWQRAMEQYQVEYEKEREAAARSASGMVRGFAGEMGRVDYFASSSWKDASGGIRGILVLKLRQP